MADHLLSPPMRAASRRDDHRPDLAVPARLTWKDPSGATRHASVVTRDVTDESVFVECETRASIPLYRLVHLQVEGAADGHDLPAPLRDGRVLSAVWHVAPCSPSTGTPGGYRLRFLVDPARHGREFTVPEPQLTAN